MEAPEPGAHPIGPRPVGPHDVGGRLPQGAAPVVKDEHPNALWEYRVDAMMMLLSHPSRDLVSMDQLRRSVESLGPGVYAQMSYYERWVTAIAHLLLERGIVTSDELGRRMAEVEARTGAAA